MITVVIPAHNRPDSLSDLLNALKNQTLKNFEVLVVIAKQNSNIFSDIKKAFPKIKFLEISSHFPDKKRNIGIKNARGDIIAFIDDDCLPKKNWLNNIEKELNDMPISAVEGKTIGDTSKLFSHATNNLRGGLFPMCNFAAKKTDLLSVKGFDENYNFFREDTDLGFKLLSVEKKIIFSSKVLVTHPPRKTNWKSIFKELKMIKGDMRLFKKFPKLYTEQFGNLFLGGGVKQAILSWVIFLSIIYSISNIIVLALFVAFLVIEKHFILMKGKKASIIERIQFVIGTFLKDLLYPFFLVFYYITINPKD